MNNARSTLVTFADIFRHPGAYYRGSVNISRFPKVVLGYALKLNL